ncbi:hypothetical protein A2765_04915 [Candidatus Kaiserbacteria bacterium RIFCSPHIGHO2_01_FULL_56_24]|uniref:Methyltransferase domain-containing protein n=1 Tax=Candidatus Kaiserbacteria bacterium RIFCSPHIGHO2_01_FULL_56_24 TaxID=1798487 RepID=A0A1F6DEY6_9BACT|nr:MAG: hypothetical protein A2765_04915 [Candidatus Kaiserbacteria bacterium RIFCSPHIGHO2_01_FULL_56_24]
MTGRLLEYEFWKDHTAYYIGLFTGVLAKKDRLEKRKYFAKEILEAPSRPIRWLDVGTGDGSKILDTIRCIKERDYAARIELIAIEPSEYIVAGLKDKLSKIDGVSLEVRNDKFALEKLKPNTFDCITFFHAAYYLATEEVEFEEIYRRVYEALKPGGVLLVQAVNENGDFQALGHPSYSIWAQGDHTFDLLKRISSKAQREDFPTRFDITDILTQEDLTPELSERFLNIYRFTTQVDSALPTKEEREKYIAHMRQLAKQNGNTFYLDFSDVVVSLHKARE